VLLLLQRGRHSLAPRAEVHDASNERIDAGNRARAWGIDGLHSWCENEFGRVAQNSPFDLVESWRQTRRPEPGG
jgi:4-hydroxyacetophenone monooxygenase